MGESMVMIYSPVLPWDGPRLTGRGRAGFPVHSHLPRMRGLMVGSTGVYGLRPSAGDQLFQVYRGVGVTVHRESTGPAGKHAHSQRQAWVSPAACGAGLRRGEPAVGHDQSAAVPAGLVLQLPADLAEPD